MILCPKPLYLNKNHNKGVKKNLNKNPNKNLNKNLIRNLNKNLNKNLNTNLNRNLNRNLNKNLSKDLKGLSKKMTVSCLSSNCSTTKNFSVQSSVATIETSCMILLPAAHARATMPSCIGMHA